MIEPPLEQDIQLSNALILIFVGSNSRDAGHHLFPGGAFSKKRHNSNLGRFSRIGCQHPKVHQYFWNMSQQHTTKPLLR
jgi:hypothetical protein